MKTVTVHASRTYDILIERGILDTAGKRIAETLGKSRVMIVTDDTVNALYAFRLENSLTDAGLDFEKFVFPHGEASKNFTTLIALLETLAESAFSRSDILVALGGGVTGDLTGFAAATFLRGIRYVGIPTTLLAVVDSSVGGKTAVDLQAGKNLAGAFWQPSLVLCDPDTLDTLPQEIYSDGMAEVIKYGVISDAELFRLLHHPESLDMEEIIARCVQAKASIVEEDEGDRGVRKLLNYGHTAGHAIEQNANFTILHGHGVAIGMMVAAKYAAKNGLCPADLPEKQEKLLRMYNLPVRSPYPADQLYQAATRDKKREKNTIDVVIPRAIGECVLHRLTVEELADYLREGCIV